MGPATDKRVPTHRYVWYSAYCQSGTENYKKNPQEKECNSQNTVEGSLWMRLRGESNSNQAPQHPFKWYSTVCPSGNVSKEQNMMENNINIFSMFYRCTWRGSTNSTQHNDSMRQFNDIMRHFIRVCTVCQDKNDLLELNSETLKGTTALKASGSEREVRIKQCNLPQTGSKSDIN